MAKIWTDKLLTISQVIETLPPESNGALGILGMARTIALMKYISKRGHFQVLDSFDYYISCFFNKIKTGNMSQMKEIQRGQKLCDRLFSDVEGFTYDSGKSLQEKSLVERVYCLLENWFFFLGFYELPMDHPGFQDLGRMAVTPLELIDEYLYSLFDVGDQGQYPMGMVQHRVNQEPMILRESRMVDRDIQLVSRPDFQSSFRGMEARMMEYMQYKFWYG